MNEYSPEYICIAERNRSFRGCRYTLEHEQRSESLPRGSDCGQATKSSANQQAPAAHLQRSDSEDPVQDRHDTGHKALMPGVSGGPDTLHSLWSVWNKGPRRLNEGR